MKLVFIFIALLLVNPSFSYEVPPIVQEMKKTKASYMSHMVTEEYEQAIVDAEKLLSMDPSYDESKFYLLYAYYKAKKPIPDWLNEEGKFNRKASGVFFKNLFFDLKSPKRPLGE